MSTAIANQLFLAYMGRPADAAWRASTATVLNSNQPSAALQTAFYNAALSEGVFSASDTMSSLVNKIFLQTFGFAANTYEQTQWANSGVSKEAMAWTIFVSYLGATNVPDVYKLPTQSKLMSIDAYTNQLQNDGVANAALSQGGTAAASARALITGVTSQATAATFITNVASNVSTSATAASIAGTNFTLLTSIDGISGTSNDDTISGLIGASGTYNVGDNITGGSGNDTLNLIDAGSATAAGLVSLRTVETVNVRSVSAGTTIVNANDWSGVTKVSNASSNAGSTLQVSGVALTTQISVNGNTDVNVAFINTTTAASAVSVALVSVGGDTTATTLASASAAATANVSLDMASADLLTAVSIDVSGTANIARIDAGSNVTSYTITGSGNAILVTDDTITSFNATAAAGNLDVSFSGASTVAVVGGAGNDTFRFGTPYNGDTVNGGAGTNTLALTIAGFNRDLSTSNVQRATVTFSESAGGTLNASASSSITTFTLAAGTAGNAGSISQIANAATVTLDDDDLGNVTLDYMSGASGTTLNLGSASGTVTLGTLAITDVAAVTINSVGVSGTVGGTIGTASFDSDLKSLAITTSGGEADFIIGTTDADMDLAGATSLTVTSNGSAAITFNAVDLAGASLERVTVAANGTDAADVTLGDVSGSAITSIVLNAASGADIVVGTLDLGNNSTAGASQSITVAVTQGDNSDVTIGAITVTSQGTTTINVTSNGTGGDLDIATILLDRAANVSADSAPLNLAFGAVSVGASATYAINNIDAQNAGTGAQITFGAVTVGDNADWSAGTVSGTATVNVDITSIALTVGSGASADLGAITLTAGAVGAVSLTLRTDASATFGAIAASAVGAFSIIVGSAAGVDIGNIAAFSGANANQGTVGAIEIAGVDGADVTYGTIAASAVGAIAVSGALDVTFGAITTTSLGSVNARQLGVSGAFTIDLSGVTNAVEVTLGAGTNTIISGVGNDVITLQASTTGNDNIQYSTTAQGVDNVINFGAGSTGADQIEVFASAIAAQITGGLRDMDGVAIGTGTVAVDVSTLVTAGTATVLAADNILVLGTALGTTAAMETFLKTGIILGSAAMAASGGLLVAWTDGTDSYISIVNFDVASAQGGGTTGTLISAALSTITLTQLSAVTPGALVAANFDFV